MSDRQVDFFDLKRVVEWLLTNRGLAPTYVAEGVPSYFHPAASARVVAGGQELGVLGEIHPRVLSALGVERPVFATELALGIFSQQADPQIYKALPRFPGVRRDVAMIVPSTMALGPLLLALRAGGTLLEDVRLFDVYQGKPIPKSFVSVALALFFRHGERTLTDDEVHSEMAELMATIKKDFPIEVRQG